MKRSASYTISTGVRAAGLLACILTCGGTVHAQLTVSPQTDLQQLAEAITGAGVQISNPTINCHTEGYGEFSYTGNLLGLSSGVMLTSGRIVEAIGPNNVDNRSFQQGTSGSSILNTVTGRTTYDACRLEFDVIPSGDSLTFKFVFGSEEYNEWVGSQYNDVFGFFISGPGITGDPGIGNDHNIALIPNTSTAVAINNVNAGQNSGYYQYNSGGQQLQMDGYTRNLVARSPVQHCQTYHLKLIVADASDRKFDSWVFIEHIQSPGLDLDSYTMSGTPEMVEGCNSGWVRFSRTPVLPTPLVLTYYIQGTATNGTDYTAIGDPDPAAPKTITIPAGQAYADQAITPLADGIGENGEYLRFILGNPFCTGATIATLDFNLIDTLAASVLPLNPTICAGNSVQLTASGGTTYAWSPASGLSCTSCPNPIASPTSTTTYSVVITNGSCTRTINRQVVVGAAQISAVLTQPLCNGGSNGAINVTTNGGAGPYSYAWTGPNGFSANTEDIVNVAAGSYVLTVTDATGCASTQGYNIGAPAALQLTLSPSVMPFGQNIACNGASTGTLGLTISGGTGPYATQWNGPNGYTSTSEDLVGLAAGNYTISVTDANGCQTVSNYTITQADALVPTAGSVLGVACFGDLSGSASISVSGGMPPYSYSWNSTPAQNTANANGLGAGSYTATITDGYGCQSSIGMVVPGPGAALDVAITGTTNVLCNGAAQGTADALAAGGTAPYTYSWNSSPVQSGTHAEDLAAGTYTVTVTDANGCTAAENVTISAPQFGISAFFEDGAHVSCYGANDGWATINVSGGSNSFTIVWNTVPPQTGTTATNLAPGNYIVQVTDNNGCDEDKFYPFTILGPSSPLTVQVDVTELTCAGASNAAFDLTLSGGMGPYTHRWYDAAGNFVNIEDPSGMDADTYTLHAEDVLGCAYDTTIVISDPPALTVSSIITPTQCSGTTSGAIDVSAGGGTGILVYTWTGPNGFASNDEDLAPLNAGTYHLTVADANGCTHASDHIVTQPGDLVAVATPGEINGWATSCATSSDGSIDLSISGGSGAYTTAWTGPNGYSNSSEDISGLLAGNYLLSVTDANGCDLALSVLLAAPPPISLTLDPADHNGYGVSCAGDADGSIDLSISNGTAPFTYAWSGPGGALANTEDINGLSEGAYDVLVTDANGCSMTGSATIVAPSPLLGTIQPLLYPGGTVISCAAANDGALDLTITGGSSPMNIAWTNGLGFNSPSEDISGLEPGGYQATITDANGCTATAFATLVAPAPIAFSAVLSSMNGSNVSCAAATDGSIDVSTSGGTGPYLFAWDNGSTSEDLSAIPAGTYVITAEDVNGCLSSSTYILTAPDALSIELTASTYPSGTNISCSGAMDGTIGSLITGGTSPYTLNWSGPNGFSALAGDIANLEAGTYALQVTDANGCPGQAGLTLVEPVAVDVQVSSTTFNGNYHIPCAGMATGNATAAASGGIPGYGYSWSGTNGYTNTGATLTGLIAGDYTVVATDGSGCTGSAIITLDEPDMLAVQIDIPDLGGFPVSCAGSDGSATASITGGTPQFFISWTGPNGFTSTQADISGLSAGDYTLSITDANGCSVEQDHTLLAPAPLSATFAFTPNLCANEANGAIDITLSGGGAPYELAWSGPNGFTSSAEDISSLPTGSYTVHVSDALGCVGDLNAQLDGPMPISSGSYVSFYGLFNLQCVGDSSGALELDPGGGTAPFDVLINGPNGYSSTQLINSTLMAGDYFITLTDQHGCSLDTTVTLTQPDSQVGASLTMSVYPSGTNVSCFGASDGWIDATITGGYGPYTFDWRGPDSLAFSTEDITGLPAGDYDYELVVIDANQCIFETTISLTQPDSILAAITLTDHNGFGVSCPGVADGGISLDVQGGNGGFALSWMGPNGFSSDQADLTGLEAGVYSVTVADMNGCTLSQDVVVTAAQPIAIVLDAFTFPSSSNISCASAADGSITATITGGVPGGTVQWTGPSGPIPWSTTIDGLAEGQYCLDMLDGNGCPAQQCMTLTAPEALEVNAIVSNAACGGANGAVDLDVNGGNAPYAFAWSNGALTEDIGALGAGPYTVTVTDLNGCSATSTATVNATPGLQANGQVTHVLCNGGNSGAIDLSILSGTAPYTFQWNNTANTEDLSGLGGGSYNVGITDANGCSWSGQWTVTESPAITLDATLSQYASGHAISTQGGNDGNIAIALQGGTAPYDIQWSTGGTGTSLNGLTAGTYTVTITDANGCDLVRVLTLTEPDDLEMPTGYTPNGDGYNDAFVIHGLEAYPANTLTVLNRWGNVVYDRLNYDNDWKGENAQGEVLPNGTYFVILNINDGERVLQSYVDLRR